MHAQLLSGVLQPELIELLVAYVFTSPSAVRAPPASAVAGLLCFLQVLLPLPSPFIQLL